MYTFLLIVHVLCSIFLVAVVLLQVGRGRGMMGFLGSSTAETLFGGRAGDMLTRATEVIAALFMVTSLSLAYISLKKTGSIAKGIKTKPGVVSELAQTESAPVSEGGVMQKSSELVTAAKEKLMKKIPKFGGKKEDAGSLKETTRSNIKYDEKGNKVIDEYKYDPSGKVTGHKEIVKDKLDKVISEKELPLEEEKAAAEAPAI